MANSFVHVELSTDDLDTAKEFYKKVFDWKLTETPMGGGMTYTMIDVGTGVGGGMMTKPMPDAPTMWLPYVAVDNARKTVERARKNGAQIIIEYQEVMSMGAFAIFVDPTGAVLGIWQSFGPMPGDKPAAKKKAARKKAAPKAAKKARTAPVSSRRKKPAGRKARR